MVQIVSPFPRGFDGTMDDPEDYAVVGYLRNHSLVSAFVGPGKR